MPALQSPWVDDDACTPPRHANPAGPAAAASVLAEQSEPASATLAAGVWARLCRSLPPGSETWAAGQLQDALRSRITPEVVAEVRRRITRTLRIGVPRTRSLDSIDETVLSGATAADLWQVSAGAPARFLAPDRQDPAAKADSSSALTYDFRGAGRDAVTLSSRLELPFPSGRLYRLQLGFVPDDSWHRVDIEVEMGGALWRAQRPEFLANALPAEWTFQPYGPDDRSTKIRFWNPLVKVASGPQYEHAPRGVRVRLTLRESSAFGAWWAKCQRNYTGALNYIPFWRYAATSLFLVVLNVIGTLFTCSLVAYACARLRWPGRDIVFGLMLATMMIPGQVTMIPHFLIIRGLGWYNTLTPLWFGSLFGNAFSIFLLRQFMKGIPRDLEDAARIDGCNAWQVYWHVMVPLVKPTLACIAIFTFMGVWNDFMGPLIYLTDQRLYPLSLGLYALNVQAGGNYGMMMASACLMTLPVIVIFFFGQKYFIQGITFTGMKG